MKKTAVISMVLLGSLLTAVNFAAAGDLEWSGLYRIEGVSIANSELDEGRTKEYGLHHLILKPKIVLGDGLKVYSRFDIFNNATYRNSQLGSYFGSGVSGTGPAGTIDGEDTMSQNQAAETLFVNQLYLTLVQEHGSVIAGRAPVQFGLGMTHNAGEGLFDHWLDNRDLVGYKMIMGNLFFLPMIGKVSEGSNIQQNDDVTDYMVQVQYENPETDMEMGIFYWSRKASQGGNDFPPTSIPDTDPGGDPGAGAAGAFDISTINLYGLKDTERYRFGMEVSHQSGSLGLTYSDGSDVTLSGLGIAGEYEYRPENSKWKFGAKFGYASGDNPDTEKEIEGYYFDRNYDVAFMLFNHSMGQANFLGTGYVGAGPDGTTGEIDTPDVDTISNVTYISPYFHWQWKEKWSVGGRLTTGTLGEVLDAEDWDTGLGYELDFSLNFSPNDRMVWVNEIGYFMPGTAFEGGINDFDTQSAFGFVTKAAISF